MKLAKSRLLRCAVGGLVLVPLGACTVAASLLSPDLAASLGITTASQGVVLVAFKNDTSSPIIFSAFAGPDRNQPTQGRTFTQEIQAGSVGNEVLDCPVDILTPGPATVEAGGTGAGTAGGGGAVTYAGPTLLARSTFVCGDTIEIRVTTSGVATTQSASGQTANYAMTVRVIRGQ